LVGHVVGGAVGLWCGLGDAEDGVEPVGVGDLDAVDEGFDERLALGGLAAGDDVVDVVGDGVQGCGRYGFGCGFEFIGEFVAALT
jgi:hypothetical protein